MKAKDTFLFNNNSIFSLQMVLDSLSLKLKGHPHFSSRKLDPSNKSLEYGRDFMIKHYAGEVTYSINGFIDKNRDTLFQDFKRLLHNRLDYSQLSNINKNTASKHFKL